MFSQDRHGLGQSFEVDVIVHPEDQFYLGKISITIVMFGLLVDSLGLAAVYVPYKAGMSETNYFNSIPKPS